MSSKRIYQFDDLVFHMNGGYELFRNGLPVKLQQRTTELLGLLIESADLGLGLIPKEQIFDRLYGKSRPTTDYALYWQVHKLRKALGDDAQHPKYISFKKGRGIEFIGQLKPVEQQTQEGLSIAKPDDYGVVDARISSTSGRSGQKPLVWKTVVLSLILLASLTLSTLTLRKDSLPGSRIPPKLHSIELVSKPVPGQQIYAELKGEGLDPKTVLIGVIGRGCPDTDPCHVPNNVLHWYGEVTDEKIQRVPLTLAPGDFEIFVQNGPQGQVSNSVPLTVKLDQQS